MVNRLFITAKQAKRGISSSGRAFGSQSKGSGFESHMLHFYRIIASEGKKYLKPEGMIFLETGSDQTEAVAALLTENGFLRVRVKEDLNRLPRVVSACAP